MHLHTIAAKMVPKIFFASKIFTILNPTVDLGMETI